jgi:ABC-type sugar transport system substrate-binding protein
MVDRTDTSATIRDGVVSIELGVSRRNLLKQLSSVGLIGSAAGLAGCSGLQESATTTNVQGDGGDGGGGGDGDGGGGSDGGDGGNGQQNTQQQSGSNIPDFTRVPLTIPPTSESMDLSNPSDPERRMVYVVHNGTNQFFTPTIAGMNDALNKLGWTGQFTGPTGNNQAKQVEIMNTQVDSLQGQRDVLATTVLDASSYAAPVEKAINNNIPVLQYNTTVDGWDFQTMMDQFGMPLPYIGQRAYPAGNAVGITAYEKAREKFGSGTELTVLPCIGVPGHPALQARTDGFENSIGQQDNVTMLEELDLTTDVAKATTRVQDAYNANNDINVILGSGFWAAAAGAKLVENEGLQDQMVIGGFDLPQSTLDAIQDGTVTFTVGQDPYSQGYVPAQFAYTFMDRGMPMKDFITGVSIIDQSNIEFAAQRSGSWAALTDWQKNNYDL